MLASHLIRQKNFTDVLFGGCGYIPSIGMQFRLDLNHLHGCQFCMFEV